VESDSAFGGEELQEEAKVLYQEWKRLQDITFQKQIEVGNAQKELNALLAEEGTALFQRQSEQLSELQEKLHKYDHVNTKLERRIRKMADKRAREEERNEEATAEIVELRRQIEEAERETHEVQESIQKSKERHQQVMRSLQESLKRKGITAPSVIVNG
jgi:chromosome segregation ATPase